MEETKILKVRVSMKPCNLDQKPGKYILKKLKEMKETLTSNLAGHVIDILDIISYSNKISDVTEDIIWTVVYKALVFRPRKDQKLEVKVTMVLASGILCNFYGIKIWVPSHLTNGYKFGSNVFRKDDDVIKVSDTIKIIISVVRYDKKAFSCIARLE